MSLKKEHALSLQQAANIHSQGRIATMKPVYLGYAFGALLIAYSIAVSFATRQQARQIAGSDAFCLQVAGPDAYEPAVGPTSTLGLLMRGHGGYHHAVLAVARSGKLETYHWSYFKHQYVAGTYGPLPIVCPLESDYFERPNPPNQKDRSTFMLLDRWRSIPTEYHPDPAWPGSFVGYTFRALAPTFAPTPDMVSGRRFNLVSVGFEGGATLEGWSKHGTDARVHKLRPVFGLERVRVDREDGAAANYHYVQRELDGSLATFITCFPGADSPCTQLFRHKGLVFNFHHRSGELPEWKAMQLRLIALDRAFSVLPKGWKKGDDGS